MGQIIFDNQEFYWEDSDLAEIKSHWKCGISLEDIARRLKRPDIEVLLAVQYLLYKGRLQARKGSIFGEQHNRQRSRTT